MSTSQGGIQQHDATGCHDCILIVNDPGCDDDERAEARSDLVRALSWLEPSSARAVAIRNALEGFLHSEADHASCDE